MTSLLLAAISLAQATADSGMLAFSSSLTLARSKLHSSVTQVCAHFVAMRSRYRWPENGPP